ncbi:MAG: hypothetical protein WCE75_04810 [Terracidiphilus sp.]
MRSFFGGWAACGLGLVLALAAHLAAQQDPFRWMDFHSEKDQDVIVWVTRSLAAEKWTAIREIGVEFDAALVITTQRATPQSAANADTFSIWSVSLTNHLLTPLLTGANLRHLDFMRFSADGWLEPAILYDNCAGCAADTYLTAFYYDRTQHGWAARWMRGSQAVPVWSAAPPPGLDWTQVFAVMAETNGREFIGTWNHIDYGKRKQADDPVYLYDRDPGTGLERMQLLTGKEAEAMKQRLCRGQDALPGLQRGQDSELCQQTVKPRWERKPVTTPPANNRGQSVPPGSRR